MVDREVVVGTHDDMDIVVRQPDSTFCEAYLDTCAANVENRQLVEKLRQALTGLGHSLPLQLEQLEITWGNLYYDDDRDENRAAFLETVKIQDVLQWCARHRRACKRRARKHECRRGRAPD